MPDLTTLIVTFPPVQQMHPSIIACPREVNDAGCGPTDVLNQGDGEVSASEYAVRVGLAEREVPVVCLRSRREFRRPSPRGSVHTNQPPGLLAPTGLGRYNLGQKGGERDIHTLVTIPALDRQSRALGRAPLHD